jgi:peptidoglycan/LPS O-acetylase OafA/YrhL
MTSATSLAGESAETALAGHRPHLDGLRAVAVYLVVLFHAGAGQAEGGFIGVDVFFVLSGFLVTRVVLTSRAAGTFTLRSFYARRVRRLLPAAVVAVLGIAWLWTVVASPAEVLAVKDGFVAALLYFANWFFITESTDYFASDLEASPVLHFWSLAIEEQFYLVWPLALLGLLKLTARTPRPQVVIRVVVAAVALASLVWALYLARGDLNRAYYGTDARAYQLLGGALLALSPGFIHRFRSRASLSSLVAALAFGALLVASLTVVDVDPVWRGVIATGLTLVLLVALETGAGPVKWLLSLAPVTYLGQISYGTYLWHWPVVLVAKQRLELSPTSTFVFAVVVATGVAALSSRVLELPIRDSEVLSRIPRQVALSGLAVSLLAALVVVPYLVEPGRVSGRTQVAGQTLERPDERIPANTVDWQAAGEDKAVATFCRDGDVAGCVLVEGSGAHITVVGDSHAIMVIPAFEQLARDNDYTLSVAVDWGCSWPEDLHAQHRSQEFRDECADTRTDWYERVVPGLDPDVVVASMVAPDDTNRWIAMSGAGETPAEIGAHARDLAEATVGRLASDGRRLVLLEPIPVTRKVNDPLQCLSGAQFVDECAFEASDTSVLEAGYREWAAASDNIFSVDYDHLACPGLPRCDAVVDGVVVRWDDTHLTKSYAVSIAADLGVLLGDALAVP